ncbi:unnamed protein product [Echinostoma caproni]|uniref:Calponin-homology (CH) domain-containing protein n=1 Tax=Echinostoma caproni TaxID=27848 RepID=A0A3P8KUR8_9TREM|nr:unnamed protein product [Echinostoma caproni]
MDESMCVVREDICDWLQRYLFSSVNAPAIEASFLLFRLRSGLWLSRLAYKLHDSVLQRAPNTVHQPPTDSYEFLRGGVSNPSLRTLSRNTLPPFPRTLITCAKLPLGPGDTCSYHEPERSDASSNASATSSPGHNSSRLETSGSSGLRVADRWVARDNVSAFLQWCKDLGIPSTVLFETTGLVSKYTKSAYFLVSPFLVVHRTEEKNVLLTLMELARIAGRFGLDDLPELVRMEREIDMLEAKRAQTSITLNIKASPSSGDSLDAANCECNKHVSTMKVHLRKRCVDTDSGSDGGSNKVLASGDTVVSCCFA